MEQSQSLQIIQQALDIAIRKGCYTLQEVEAILEALKSLSTEQ